MSRVVYPEFEHGRRYVPARPNFLRRVISRYQLVELTVIVGGSARALPSPMSPPDVLPAAQGLVPLLKLAPTVPKPRFQCARKLLGWTADGLDPR